MTENPWSMNRCFLTLSIVAFVVAAMAGWFGVPAHAVNLEQGERAQYLSHFGRYITWPQKPDTITLCMNPEPKLEHALTAIKEGDAAPYTVLVNTAIKSNTVEGCQMLYLHTHQTLDGAALLAAARTKPVLTVGEGAEFLAKGGMIAFKEEHGRLVIEVNLDAAEKAGLKLDAQLLEVARRVVK